MDAVFGTHNVEGTHVAELITEPGFGYLLKDRVLDVADFLAAADRGAHGGSVLYPHVVAGLLGRDSLSTFSGRECTVLELMAQGLTNTGVAKRLQLSERTVEAHVRHLLIKLDLPSDEDGHRRVLAVLAHLNATRWVSPEATRRNPCDG